MLFAPVLESDHALCDRGALRAGETLLSQLAHKTLGDGVLYAFVQGATALILLFAANTAFWLTDFLAQSGRDQWRFVRRKARAIFRRLVRGDRSRNRKDRRQPAQRKFGRWSADDA